MDAPVFEFIHIFIHVIKLKDILKEIHDDEMEHCRSWLSPHGEFIPTNDENGKMISHPSKAEDILSLTKGDPTITTSDYLYKRGWQRVIYGKLGQFYRGSVLFSTNPFIPPNEIQKNKLIKLAQKFSMNQVIYDNEKLRVEKYSVVWDKDDVLKEVLDDRVYNNYSWQNPDGKFIPIKRSHAYDASQILLKMGIKSANQENAEKLLQRMRWNRINSGSIHALYCNNHLQPPSDIQKRKLIELALQLDIVTIVWDNNIKDKIIWSKNDVLEENELYLS